MKNKKMKELLILSAICAIACFSCDKTQDESRIKAYNIDFNWGEGGAHGFARPGLWADADPKAHVEWYEALGCNAIHSMAVSCNGYAWYKNGFVPEQPGLKYDFLTEQVKIARKKGIKVFGYFCVSANNKWEEDHPDLCYHTDGMQIPLTTTYLDYLCASIEDAIKKTDIDGVMLDWFYNPGGSSIPLPPVRWLSCEKEMYHELFGEDFPGVENLNPEKELLFRQKSIGRAWEKIRSTVKQTKPSCLIWLTVSEANTLEYQGNTLLQEADWLMNEAGDTARTQKLRSHIGKHAEIITCLANWNKQDPKEIVPLAMSQDVGLYGFAKPVKGSMMLPVDYYLSHPVDSLTGDEKNIAVLARTFNNLPLD
jgi:hypothetical protein